MRFFALSLLLVSLSGCIWLPISGDMTGGIDDRKDSEIEVFLGQSLDEVKDRFPRPPDWEFSEGGRRHLLYFSSREFGLIIAGGPYGAVGGLIGEQTKCYRLTFDGNGKLEEVEQKIADTDLLRGIGSEESVDCRRVFWSSSTLLAERAAQDQRAADGDRDAAFRLAQEYGDSSYLKTLAEGKDLEAAILLAVKFEDTAPLMEAISHAEGAKPTFTSDSSLKYDQPEEASHKQVRAGDGTGGTRAEIECYLNSADVSCLCRAADMHDREAQMLLGDIYAFGSDSIRQDNPQAFKWYRLAALDRWKRAELAIAIIMQHMTQGEISDGQMLFSSWQPGLCEAEIEDATVSRR